MTESQQRGFRRALICALIASGTLFATYALLSATGALRPRFTLHVLAISQGPTKEASLQWSRISQASISALIAHGGLTSAIDTDQMPALLLNGRPTQNFNELATVDGVTVRSEI